MLKLNKLWQPQAHISTLDVVVIMSVSGLHVNSTYLR